MAAKNLLPESEESHTLRDLVGKLLEAIKEDVDINSYELYLDDGMCHNVIPIENVIIDHDNRIITFQ